MGIIESLVKQSYNGNVGEYESVDYRLGQGLDHKDWDVRANDYLWETHRGEIIDNYERRLRKLNYVENLIETDCLSY